MPRAYWRGYLRLSLVGCPIELLPATSQSEKTHFHQTNTRTGHRLRQQMVDEALPRAVTLIPLRRGMWCWRVLIFSERGGPSSATTLPLRLSLRWAPCLPGAL
jgi:hypothetical protein